MENLKEKAAEYAEEKVVSVMKEAIAKIYADGYRDGYKDCKEEIAINLHDNQTKYIDLGLPSGTLWSANYEKEDKETLFLPYDKAKEMNLPKEEQWNELLNHCRWQGEYSTTGVTFEGLTCIGPNGNSIRFHSEGFMKDNRRVNHIYYGGGQIYFWLFDNEENDQHEKKYIHVNKGEKGIPQKEIGYIFSGYKLPVRLVKKE